MLTALTEPPLTPDEVEARNWVLEELSKQEYQQAKPNALERFLQRMWEQFGNFLSGQSFEGGGINPWVIITIVIVILVIVALVLFGRPRAIARRNATTGTVFLDDDARSAAELRSAAESAAARHDWSLAVVERFRAIARSLSDRTLITLRPGSTAQVIMVQAVTAFPDRSSSLHDAANLFDGVRYLGLAGTQASYESLRALDEQLETARPNSAALTPAGGRQP